MKIRLSTFLVLASFFVIGFCPVPIVVKGQSLTIENFGEDVKSSLLSNFHRAPENISIVRDNFGVPRVFARTDRGAYFGAGYAAAQDRFFQMSWRRLIFQGRTAEFFGPGTTLIDGQLSDRNIVNDREMRTIGIARYVDRIFPTLDSEIQTMLHAYADGVNAYISSNGAEFSHLFATHGVEIEHWRPQDCMGVWYSFAQHFSSKPYNSEAELFNDFAGLVNGGSTRAEAEAALQITLVCNPDAAVIQQDDVPQETQTAMAEYASQNGLEAGGFCGGNQPEGPHFSHAWAVSGDLTTTGSSALVGEPRIAVQAPNHLYEFGMTGKTFAVTGAGLPGSPNILVGHAQNVAWGVTALGMDQGDLYFLRTDEANHPGQYFYDGEWVDYLADENQDLLVKNPQGGAPTVHETIRYRETIWGPVVTGITSDAAANQEYAARMVPLFQTGKDCSRGMLDIARADDIHTFYEAADGWIFPSANIVFADSTAGIGYTVVGTFPVRNPDLPLAGQMAADGSTSASQWIDLLPNEVRPHVFNPDSGYLFSGNHIPIGNWYPIPTPWLAHGESFRSKRLRELFNEHTFPTSIEEVFRFHADTVSSPRRNFAEIGIWLRDNQPGFNLSPEAMMALEHLEPWLAEGATMDNQHYATLLADRMMLIFRENVGDLSVEFGGGDSGLVLFFNSLIAKTSAQPPEPLAQEEAAYVDLVLANAFTDATALAGAPSEWQEWYAINRLTYQFEVWNSLEKAPPLDPGNFVTAMLPTADNSTILSSPSQTFTQMVDLGDIDAGLSLLPPGNTEFGFDFDSLLGIWETSAVKPAPITFQGLQAAGISSSIIVRY